MKTSTQNRLAINIIILIILFVAFLIITTTLGYASTLNQGEAIYIVQQNDTLNSIALQFGVSTSELQAENNIADPNTLMIGERLIIPGLTSVDGILTTNELPLGTSLTNLSRKYRLSQQDLQTLNRLTSPSETIAGQRFILPLNEDEDLFHPIAQMKINETPLEVAIRTNTSPWALVENNQLSTSWALLPGEVLFGLGEDNTRITQLSDLVNISVYKLPLIQGETTEIWIKSTGNVNLSGELNGDPLNFYSDDGINFYSFYGVHALAEIGPVSLQLTEIKEGDNTESFEQLVLIASGGYGNEYVNVPNEYLDQSVIDDEDALVQKVLSTTSPDRYWQGRFQYPIDEPCLNSLFGQRRDYNNGGLFFYHTGLDFGVCAPNLNIYAAANGKVILAEELTIRGKAILIDHGWGVVSGYWHLSEFNVSEGDMVQAGDLIGQIGNTGRSAGPHLHFEIDIFGTPVNPQTWLDEEFPSIEP